MTLPEFGRYLVSAVIGSLLTLVVTLTAQHQSQASTRAATAAENERKDTEARKQLLNQLAGAYDDFGDAPRRAAEFAEGNGIGRADDVRVVMRHFARVVRMVRTGQVTAEEAANHYGGRMSGWGRRFTDIASGRFKVNRAFSNVELHNMRLLGPALVQISEKATDPELGEDMDDVSEYDAVSNSADAAAPNSTL